MIETLYHYTRFIEKVALDGALVRIYIGYFGGGLYSPFFICCIIRVCSVCVWTFTAFAVGETFSLEVCELVGLFARMG